MKKLISIGVLLVFSLMSLSACVNQQVLDAQKQAHFDQQLAKHVCFSQHIGTMTQPAQYYLEDCYQKTTFPPMLIDIQNKNAYGKTIHQKFLIQTVQVKRL